MGLLGILGKKSPRADSMALRLPKGSFTVDPQGRVVASTLPSSFPAALTRRISSLVLGSFQSAREARLPISDLVADFAAFKLTAREMRGGAIIFLAPRTFGEK